MPLGQSAAKAVAPNRRAHKRYDLDASVTIQVNGRSYRAKSLNISEGGMSLSVQGIGKFAARDAIAVFIQNYPPIEGIVRWVKGRSVGVQFISGSSHKELLALIGRLNNGESPFPGSN